MDATLGFRNRCQRLFEANEKLVRRQILILGWLTFADRAI
mgnify:CR=1 FL=1